ncbi:hypothetical protein AYL99_11914 [Fonsecaea erecta]|uniref:Uncharacterized protein n=1 Tax=Fonsecaea erecta TaxID=1367422 RepID=A0A178Z275_9EURO|nr:hypothetical protein AYL99_11914 [Fonsecaea erecta]OAP53892.1 hypothetical protein AYL99_11914 [Fonsecaea erecta]
MSIVIGGRPQTGPMQTIGGVRGSRLFEYPHLVKMLEAYQSQTTANPDSADPTEQISAELIAAHYLSLVKDMARVNDLCTIARNLLATTKKAQNLAAEKGFDQQILELINGTGRKRKYDEVDADQLHLDDSTADSSSPGPLLVPPPPPGVVNAHGCDTKIDQASPGTEDVQIGAGHGIVRIRPPLPCVSHPNIDRRSFDGMTASGKQGWFASRQLLDQHRRFKPTPPAPACTSTQSPGWTFARTTSAP